MEYQVESPIREKLQKLLENEQVKKGLDFIKEDEQHTLDQQIELALIEAPTFQEKEKGERMAGMFKEEGLADVQTDSHGNVFGYRRGKGQGPIIVVEGHMDTVFPRGSVKGVEKRDGKIYCPGICDDTRGCVTVLSTLRALNAAGIETEGDIIFMGTVEEEGMGALGGLRKFLADHPEIGGSISIDGSGFDEIVYEATGIRTVAVTFHGIGGHAMGAFGKIANPLHAAARAVAKIADIQVPEDPRTTYAVTNFHAGNDAGIHAIVQNATIKMNFRSNGVKELAEMEAQIRQAVADACKEETARWGKDEITFTWGDYVNVPAGTQDRNAPIVQSLYSVMETMGFEPKLEQGGSTNASDAIALGIPGVCIGGGGKAGGVHSLDEWFDPTDAYKGVQTTFLLTLMTAGIAGESETVLTKK